MIRAKKFCNPKPVESRYIPSIWKNVVVKINKWDTASTEKLNFKSTNIKWCKKDQILKSSSLYEGLSIILYLNISKLIINAGSIKKDP